jgi:hypothetical protein
VVEVNPPESLSAADFWATYIDTHRVYVTRDLVLDGTPYPHLNTALVPVGYTSVDIKLLDNGKPFDCAMVAGMVGMQVSSSGDTKFSLAGAEDVVRPVSGWCMYVKK